MDSRLDIIDSLCYHYNQSLLFKHDCCQLPQPQPRPGIQHQLCEADSELICHLQGLDLLLRLLPGMKMMVLLKWLSP